MNAEAESEEGGDESRVCLAFVLLQEARLPTLEQINEALAAHGCASRLEPYSEEEQEELESKDTILACQFEGASTFVSVMPAPFPWSDLEGPCETAWWWPEATETLEDHGAHLIVTMLRAEGDALERSLRLTRLVAGVLRASHGLGVYWGNGPLVHSHETFWEDSMGANREEFPLHLWVEQRIFSEREGTCSVFTSGLRALGGMEIEVRESESPPSEVMELVFGVSYYQTQQGPVIKDGDTVGGSEEERIQAHHQPSLWEREGPVLVIDM